MELRLALYLSLMLNCFVTCPEAELVLRRQAPKVLVAKEAGHEVITCNHTPIKASRSTIVEFIESFCAEVVGQHFGASNRGLRERYNIPPSPVTLGMATHFELELWSVNGCSFVVDESCGRFLTRPTDECNVGEEEKQGGVVTDGCSLWIATPIL